MKIKYYCPIEKMVCDEAVSTRKPTIADYCEAAKAPFKKIKICPLIKASVGEK